MNRTLHIPEILGIIFGHLDPSDILSGKDSSRTLAALARTCKAFKNPALDALWTFHVDLIPALRCFPEDIWDRTLQIDQQLNFVAFRRPLTPEDWEVPLDQWKRIKIFRIFTFDTSRISLAVCETLRICCPDSILFPNVQEVSWYDMDPRKLPILSLLLSSRLHRISIGSGESTILSTLGNRSPDLTHVDLRGQHSGLDILPSVVTLMSKLQRLESLFIVAADAAILQLAARMSRLRYLVVDKVLHFGALSLQNVPRPHFPSLEILNLWATTVEVARTIIAATHHPLTAVNLLCGGGLADCRTIARLYTALAAPRVHSALHTLHIEVSGNHPEIIAGDTLRILFPFTHLRTIVLKPYLGFDLDDDLLLEVARTWTRVEDLRLAVLNTNHPMRVDVRVTLTGIHALAKHCPKLRNLEITFDATSVPELKEVWAQEKLTMMRVDLSPISSPADVATFLSRIFPGLQELESYCPCDKPKTELWKRVDRYLKAGTEFAHDDESADGA
ncbi:hypothetical protein C8F04DRAFT_1003819 [Mycena alexandri]|uniref:F-box domain-containing protein n=1 Tax=Mycena alexandri TaxID=1745969 RepID=A0AAD6X0Y2_9AGAR|nr:hypothetical protein C8F04DRAFT_1003819 [Mycena alexandri]